MKKITHTDHGGPECPHCRKINYLSSLIREDKIATCYHCDKKFEMDVVIKIAFIVVSLEDFVDSEIF